MDKKQCCSCHKDFNHDQLFACDGCKKEYCVGEKCADLTASEIKCLQLKTKRKLIFLCEECETGLWKVPILEKKLNEVTEKLEKLIEKSAANPTAEVVQASPSVGINTEEVIMEIMERQKRETNIIISGIKESESDSYEMRKEEDLSAVREILQKCVGEVDIVKIFRLGRKTENKIRLVKVILKSREEALEILKNKNKVTGSRVIKIFSDQTKKQKEYYQQVKNKLSGMRANGVINKVIKYVNNVPTIIDKMTKN